MRIAIIVGTRPEAIKMAPVIREIKARRPIFEPLVIATAQHREMLDQALGLFGIVPDHDLNLMHPGQSLSDLTCRVLDSMGKLLAGISPDMVLVQGDTTTVFAASLAAFYRKIPVAHVEAGLRSNDLMNPYPEEANRKLTTVLAGINFAPTAYAKSMLLNENIPAERIVCTGNTVVDALQHVLSRPFSFEGTPLEGIPFDTHRTILLTSHRRETLGTGLKEICLAVRDLIARYPDLLVVYPVHLNPEVQKTVRGNLEGLDRVFLVPPLDYLTFVNLMRRAYLILTDSGGLQEEAPTLRKPILVLRSVTERPEAFSDGPSRLIGTAREAIVSETANLLDNAVAYQAAIHSGNPYGDGRAARRIALALERWTAGQSPLLNPDEEFVHPSARGN
jgi:UDP-N-acetylglucosamine 2-epimerase (non-hydrolysing)